MNGVSAKLSGPTSALASGITLDALLFFLFSIVGFILGVFAHVFVFGLNLMALFSGLASAMEMESFDVLGI
jgi:hypothetical protein